MPSEALWYRASLQSTSFVLTFVPLPFCFAPSVVDAGDEVDGERRMPPKVDSSPALRSL